MLNNQPKKEPVKKYFPLPYEIFCLGLSAGEIAVYSYLMSRENRKTNECWPSYSTIGDAVNMCNNTVMKHVNKLREKRLIETVHTEIKRKDNKKYNGNLLYHILPIQEAIDYFNEIQHMLECEQEEAKHAEERLRKYDQEHPRDNNSGTSEQQKDG